VVERTPEDLAAGILRIAIGGSVKAVPTLPIKDIPAWAELLDELTPSMPPAPADDGLGDDRPDDELPPADDPRGYQTLTKATTESLLRIVTAYDRTGALGGREWLEEHADLFQLKTAAEQMAANAFPLGEGDVMIAQVLLAQIMRGAVPSPRPSSTNGASPTGTRRPNRSERRSTRSS